MNFRELGLNAPILRALTVAGYTEPTPIQTQAIPPALAGRDVLGCAQTGTGKTCAFATPILQRLDGKGRRDGIRALILTPTRELAIQIGDSFTAYGTNLSLRHTVIYGGVGQQPQIDAINAGLDILVATPGRLLDLQSQGQLALDKIEIFVLDEADRMLDMGFIHDVKRILKLLPEKKQTMLFSATMPPEVMGLVNGLLKDYVRVAVDPISSPVEVIRQSLYYVDKGNKSTLLAMLLEKQHIPSALVFSRTKHGANRIAQDMEKRGISAAAIHGNKSQSARVQALGDFKAGKIRVLVATDIAARGIDIEEMPCVVNYNLPDVPETYVHRIGRTGRAGHEGIAISFCAFDEMEELKAIEKLLGKPIPVVKDHPYPMRNTDPPKRDKNGKPINEEDEEARQAAREKKAEQNRREQEEKKAATAQPEQPKDKRAAASQPEQTKDKKAAAGQPDQPKAQLAPPTKPAPQTAAPAAKGKKSKGQQSVEEKQVEPMEDRPQEIAPEMSNARSGGLSSAEPKPVSALRPGKSEEPDDEQWTPRIRTDHPLTANMRQGRLEDTLPEHPSMPKADFIKPSPLDFDTVIDATARLLSARSAESWRERIRRTEMGEFPEDPKKKKQAAQKPEKKGSREAGKPQEKPAERQPVAKNGKGPKPEAKPQGNGRPQGSGRVQTNGKPQPNGPASGKPQQPNTPSAQKPQSSSVPNGRTQANSAANGKPQNGTSQPVQKQPQNNGQAAAKQNGNGKVQNSGKQPSNGKGQANGNRQQTGNGRNPRGGRPQQGPNQNQSQNPAQGKPQQSGEQPQKQPVKGNGKPQRSQRPQQQNQGQKDQQEPQAAAAAVTEENGGTRRPRTRKPPRPRRPENTQTAPSGMKPYYVVVDHDDD